MSDPTQNPPEPGLTALLAAVHAHLSLPMPAADSLTARDERDRLLAHRAADVAFVLGEVVLAARGEADETTEVAAARAVSLLPTWAERYPVTYPTEQTGQAEAETGGAA